MDPESRLRRLCEHFEHHGALVRGRRTRNSRARWQCCCQNIVDLGHSDAYAYVLAVGTQGEGRA